MRPLRILVAVTLLLGLVAAAQSTQKEDRRLLYVAVPGVRNYLEHGGHGLLVFDIDQGHRFVRRIPMGGLDENGRPLNVKGIAASAATGRLYVSTIRTLMSFDLMTDKMLWEKSYEGGCDRMAISPDGKSLYLPSLEKDHWHVVDAASGDVLAKVVPKSGAHNTIYGPDGKEAYLAGLRSPLLTADYLIVKGSINSARVPSGSNRFSCQRLFRPTWGAAPCRPESGRLRPIQADLHRICGPRPDR